MSEMLEKVARAVAECGPVGCCTIGDKQAVEIAIAAVRALREPDDAMLDKMSDLPIDGQDYGRFWPSLHDCGELWKQGIDSILSTPTTRGEVK